MRKMNVSFVFLPLFLFFFFRVLTLIPSVEGELIDRGAIVHVLLLFKETLFFHLDFSLQDLIGREGFDVGGEADGGAQLNQPLARIEMVPEDAIAVILGELVMVIVITLAARGNGRDPMVLWCVNIVVWRLAHVVRKAIDTEHGVVCKNEADHTGINETTLKKTFRQTRHSFSFLSFFLSLILFFFLFTM